MKKYLKDLEAELRKNKLSDDEINEILADHEEMIESAINEGLTDEELEAKFGNPEAVAEELADFSEKQDEKEAEQTVEGNKRTFSNISDTYNVEIALVNEDVVVKVHEKETIIVEMIGKIKEEDYEIGFVEGKFTLALKRDHKRKSYFGNDTKKKFVVYLPEAGTIEDFKITIVNGDGKIKNISSTTLKLGTNNGDFKLKEISTGKLGVNTVNGDLALESVKCDELKLSLVSGDIKAKEIAIKNDFSCNSVSGDMVLEDVSCDDFTLRTVSGDVKGKDFYPNTVGLTTVSGDVVITNSKEKHIKVKHKRAVSGDVSIKVK